jgi:hypothetical protein
MGLGCSSALGADTTTTAGGAPGAVNQKPTSVSLPCEHPYVCNSYIYCAERGCRSNSTSWEPN